MQISKKSSPPGSSKTWGHYSPVDLTGGLILGAPITEPLDVVFIRLQELQLGRVVIAAREMESFVAVPVAF